MPLACYGVPVPAAFHVEAAGGSPGEPGPSRSPSPSRVQVRRTPGRARPGPAGASKGRRRGRRRFRVTQFHWHGSHGTRLSTTGRDSLGRPARRPGQPGTVWLASGQAGLETLKGQGLEAAAAAGRRRGAAKLCGARHGRASRSGPFPFVTVGPLPLPHPPWSAESCSPGPTWPGPARAEHCSAQHWQQLNPLRWCGPCGAVVKSAAAIMMSPGPGPSRADPARAARPRPVLQTRLWFQVTESGASEPESAAAAALQLCALRLTPVWTLRVAATRARAPGSGDSDYESP